MPLHRHRAFDIGAVHAVVVAQPDVRCDGVVPLAERRSFIADAVEQLVEAEEQVAPALHLIAKFCGSANGRV
jgi:hypothetical protein